MDKYVLLEDVEDLISLIRERELFADHVRHYEDLTDSINRKIRIIRENAEEIYREV